MDMSVLYIVYPSQPEINKNEIYLIKDSKATEKIEILGGRSGSWIVKLSLSEELTLSYNSKYLDCSYEMLKDYNGLFIYAIVDGIIS
jgi:hypothetical protein